MRSLSWLFYGVACGALLATACSQEKLGELADKAKQAVKQGAEKVQEQASAVTDTAKEKLDLAGSCELVLDTPFTCSACYFTFLTPGLGRPQVLQMRSYRNPEQESFPAYLLQATTPATGLSELAGQTIPAQLFVQQAATAPVWFSSPDEPVEMKVVAVNDQELTVEITGGSLRNSQSGADQTVTGKLVGVPQ
jgi:hypothetical protein